MPIYAYRCEACGHAKDVLQKISDPALTVCPVCGADAYRKQVTAAGFQLKGSGWYVTDFRDQGKKAGSAPAAQEGAAEAPEKSEKAEGSAETKSDTKVDVKADAKSTGASSPPAASGGAAPAAAPAPAPSPSSPKSTS